MEAHAAFSQSIDDAQSMLDTELAEDWPAQNTDAPMHAPLGFDLPPDFLLSAVVPAFNEEKTIRKVVRSLFALPLPVEVIVIDDGSSDSTPDVLNELSNRYAKLTAVTQPSNQGKGAALRRGFELAAGTHIIVQDADLEYNPDDIPSLVRPLVENEADVVYGSRFLKQTWKGSSLAHRFGNRSLTWISNRMTGLNLTDMETCYKVLPRPLLNRIALEQNGFGFEVELTAKLARKGVRVVERPISYHARSWQEGKKINWRDGVHALYCIFRYG